MTFNTEKTCIVLISLFVYSAGVMYWGDARHDIVETAHTDGTRRRVLLTENTTHYFAFLLRDGDIYITDWAYTYVSLRPLNVC